MSHLSIPDDVLSQLGKTERQALIEIACRLYETKQLAFDKAARMADLDLEPFAAECTSRRIAVYWYKADDLRQDLQTLEKMGL